MMLSLTDASRNARRNSSQMPAVLDSDPSITIVNGRDSAPCRWKWQIGLQDLRYPDPSCGGTLIHPQWVLTAAHCRIGTSGWSVWAGYFDYTRKTGTEQTRSVSQVVNHPNYDRVTKTFDFALVRLSTPFSMTTCVGPAPLPSSNVAPGASCNITGWGNMHETLNRYPTKLQEGVVRVISNADCVSNFNYTTSEIHASMICGQGTTSTGLIVDACQGDSVGPMICNGVLHGVTSWELESLF